MSETKVQQSGSASVELERTGDRLSLSFVDAEVWQWHDMLADVGEFESEDDMVGEIAKSIELYADDLARSLVKAALKRGLLPEGIAEPAGGQEGRNDG